MDHLMYNVIYTSFSMYEFVGIYVYIQGAFKKVLTFLWEFLYDIMILKSRPVHRFC